MIRNIVRNALKQQIRRNVVASSKRMPSLVNSFRPMGTISARQFNTTSVQWNQYTIT